MCSIRILRSHTINLLFSPLFSVLPNTYLNLLCHVEEPCKHSNTGWDGGLVCCRYLPTMNLNCQWTSLFFLFPQMIKNLLKASRNYLEWKINNHPNFKPWIYPEQLLSPRISIEQVSVDPMHSCQCRLVLQCHVGQVVECSPTSSRYLKWGLKSRRARNFSDPFFECQGSFKLRDNNLNSCWGVNFEI